MGSFARSFAVDALAKWDESRSGNAVRALFDRWCLPGEAANLRGSLRLGVRDGYLNFYIKGQSVAKLSCGRKGPTLSVHNAYVTGRRREKNGNATPPVKGYQDYGPEALAMPSTAALIPHWIDTAQTYASAEKRFVDDLVAANPGVIDLEMGLPSGDRPGIRRVAPRMDLVVVQCAGGASPSIGFWEAKCADNSELRAHRQANPKVLEQVEKYVAWMEDGDRITQVLQAYRNTAITLLKLHRLFRENDGPTPACVSLWQALAELETPSLTVQPGVVIGNYCPDGHAEKTPGRITRSAVTFAVNRHREKLRGLGIQLHEVGQEHQSRDLPVLGAATARS